MSALILKLAVGALVAYGAIVAAAWAMQRSLMYIPDPQRRSPAAAGLASSVSEVTITTPDGADLVAWYAPARAGQPTLLYLHGNGGHLAARATRMQAYLSAGQGVFMLAWRGYSGSSGRPSEAHNVADAERAYAKLLSLGVREGDVVLYGESLGSGVAVQLAARHPVGGVILDAPYTSIREIAAAVYWFLPVSYLLVDRYETMAHVGRITAPLLVLHGERDDVIPVAMGRAVHDAARSASMRRLVTFPLAGHTDHYMHGSFQAVQAWLADVQAARQVQ